MDLGGYYSQSINGFTKNPLLAVPTLVGYIIIYAIIFLAVYLFAFSLYGSSFLGYSQSSTSMMSNYLGLMSMFFGIMILILVVYWVVGSIMSAATIGMSKDIILGGRPDLGVAVEYIKKYFLKMMLLSLIFALFILIALIPAILGLFLLGVDPSSGLGIIGLIIGGLITLILMIGVFLFFIFINQSVIICENSIIGSFKDSYKLVKNNLLEVIIVLVINLIIQIAVGVILWILSFIGIIPIVGTIIVLIIDIIAYSIMLPYLTLVLNYLYMDLKMVLPEEAEYGY